MKIAGRTRRAIPWKRMSAAVARLIGEELTQRVQTNLTPAERRELGELALEARDEVTELALWARHELRELAADPHSRRLGQLVAQALTDRSAPPKGAAVKR
jgi:hypothetical protein